MRLAGTCVLVLSVFAFAVPAYAGNGNGNGNDEGIPGAGDAARGNAANAPGHEKKAEAVSLVATTTTTIPTVTTTSAAQAAVPTEGVKPSNDTAHETHAQAQSSDTKSYGNGRNAGEIAMTNGASGSTVLYGPGNSQPHKAAPCSGGHERDVHALKGHPSATCATDPPAPNPHPTPSSPPHVGDQTSVVITGPKKPTAVDPAPARQPNETGELPGEQAEHSRNRGDGQGVLSATQRVGRVASLPFTGQNLWIAVCAGLMLIATGFALRQIRTVEALVESDHDHTDRARHSARSSRSSVGGRSGR